MEETAIGKKLSAYDKLNEWRKQYVADRHFTLMLSFLVGIFAAFAAFVLHGLINQIEALLTHGFHIESFNWLYLVFPVVGIYLTSLFVRYVVKDNISHGITRILYAISRKQSRLNRQGKLKRKRQTRRQSASISSTSAPTSTAMSRSTRLPS